MGDVGLPRSDGAWETVGGWGGYYRHATHPEWEIHVVDEPQRAFMLRNAVTGAERDLGEAAARGGLYLAMDLAHAAITSGTVLDLWERLGQLSGSGADERPEPPQC